MSKDKQQAQMFLDAAARLEAEKEFNFCPKCGKRLASGFVEISIHTCTPLKKKS
jgi:NADH pyrophosphatase NudC (nudix superfamily)